MPKAKSASNVVELPAQSKPAGKKKSTVLTDQHFVDALNTRKDEEGNPLPTVTLANLWSECRAGDIGHRQCRCGKPGCAGALTNSR